MTMPEILGSFACESLFDASGKLLKHLGVKCSTQTEEPIPFLELYEDAAKDAGSEVPKPIKKVFARVDKTYFIGTVDDDTLGGKNEKVDFAAVAEKPKYEGMFVFAVQMKEGEELTRTEASLIVRGINRVVKQMPATVLIAEKRHTEARRHGGEDGLRDSVAPCEIYLSIATCERTEYRQSWRPGEKLGRVSILKGINCLNPHRGHLDILESMNVKKAKTFDALYEQWKDVFSSKLLTKQFYREIQNWYFWALKKEQHVSFPNALDDDSDDELFNSENVIRLITRLIFTWFMKEKQLVNPDLFNPEFLSAALKHFNAEGTISDPKDRDADKSCTYYRAVLQNLFFATFNQEIKMRDFVETQVRDSKRYNIKNYFRNAKLFNETDKHKIIGYFNGSPFVNGGLFECLDNVEQNGRVYSWDGFSNSVRFQDGSLKSALIPDRLFFGGETTTDLSEFFEKDKSAKCVKVRGIINILNDYVFTIEENTPLDEDVALDPELLGKVFENLLGCYNPETQQMARNSTGSFYTPREIVNYMVRVSLKAYLKRKCPKVVSEEIDALVNGTAELDEMPSVKANAKDILTALFKAKILDPACGSGAFPMGIMLTMVDILRKVDPDNRHWYEIVLKESLSEAESVAEVGDEQERAELKAQIEYDFNERMDHPDYARKLYVIEHCIFGGDIQPIAVQISRLRFFITLLCEQTRTDDPDTNYGITPLPNLENNFVAANSLLSIDLKDMRELLGQKKIVQLVKQLRAVRHQLFLPKTSVKKKRLQRRDEELRTAIAAAAEGLYDENVAAKLKLLEGEVVRAEAELAKLSPDDFKDVIRDVEEVDLFGNKTVTKKKIVGKGNELKKRRDAAVSEVANLKNSSRKERLLSDLKRLVAWNPFAFNVAEKFLDPEWMFGVKEGFDIVIGNPPYISAIGYSKITSEEQKENLARLYSTAKGAWDLYVLFFERGLALVGVDGLLSYITPNKYLSATYGKALRSYFVEHADFEQLIDLSRVPVFESASVYPVITTLRKGNQGDSLYVARPNDVEDLGHALKGNRIPASVMNVCPDYIWGVLLSDKLSLLSTVLKNTVRFETVAQINATTTAAEADEYGMLLSNESVNSRLYNRVVNTGTIDPYVSLWGKKPLTHQKRKFATPYLPVEDPLINDRRREMYCSPKIIFAKIGIRAEAFFDEDGSYASLNTNCVYAPREGYSLKFLAGLCNSSMFSCVYELLFGSLRMSGGYLQYQAPQLRVMPIPVKNDTRIDGLVDAIIVAKKADANADTSALEAEIDDIVFDLYGLTAEERVLVQGAGK